MSNKTEYNRQYYRRKKEEIARRRKTKYEKDTEYREQVKARRKDYYWRQREETGYQKRGRKGLNVPRIFLVDGKIVYLYRIGPICTLLQRNNKTIECWVRDGIIPAIKDDRGRLWFSERVLKVCQAASRIFRGRYTDRQEETAALKDYLKEELSDGKRA